MTSPEKIVLCQYHYDALNWLVSHLPMGALQHQRFYCKSRLATEIQGAVRHSIFQQGDSLLAQQRSADGETDTSLLATDQQRSVLHTLKANQQRQPIAYSPYGHRPAENGLLSLLGFNGERPDPVTGHYLLGNGYRAFNPVLMRFNSPDSLSPFEKGGLNSYAYCLGDPINLSDPNGHAPFINMIVNSSISPMTITQHYKHGSTTIYKLKPNISIQQAEHAITRINSLSKAISEKKLVKNSYIESLNSERLNFDNNTKLNLQNIAIKSIQSNAIPTTSLPPRLQEATRQFFKPNDRHQVLEYINAAHHEMDPRDHKPFSASALHAASKGEFDPSLAPSLYPNRDAAKKYQEELYNIKHPNFEEIKNKILSIRETHFL